MTARDWVNMPANLLYPESFADSVRQQVADTRIAVDVLDDTALSRGGYGGLLAVGGGSSRPPRLVRLAYRPRGAKTHLALVGKGITFDSGGLNLKPAEGMYTMKCDMAGAATVFAATEAIARLGLKINVTTYGALAENLPSSTAYRPSDVLTMYGGKTVENGNSDAEGRLVMADALVRSGEDEPDLVIDVATLTGACVIALGERTAGLMSDDEELADQLLGAAEVAGEQLWQLPIPKEIRPKLDSKVADLRSVSRRPVGRRTRRCHLPPRVRAGRRPLGPPRHRRTRVSHRQALRICRPGWHRRRCPHPGRPRPLARALTPQNFVVGPDRSETKLAIGGVFAIHSSKSGPKLHR